MPHAHIHLAYIIHNYDVYTCRYYHRQLHPGRAGSSANQLATVTASTMDQEKLKVVIELHEGEKSSTKVWRFLSG